MTGLEIALLLGLIGSAAATTAGTLYTNKTNRELNSQRWSESIELANTAHQREVADLKAAGLNPILSTGTAGAAVPSMASAEVSNPLEGLGNLGKTSANMMLNSANTKSQVDLNKANTDLANKRDELAGMQMASMEGDVAFSKLKSDLANEPQVKKALRDELLLRGAPKNAYEATYLGGSDGHGVFSDKVRKFFNPDHWFKRVNDKFGPGGYYWRSNKGPDGMRFVD